MEDDDRPLPEDSVRPEGPLRTAMLSTLGHAAIPVALVIVTLVFVPRFAAGWADMGMAMPFTSLLIGKVERLMRSNPLVLFTAIACPLLICDIMACYALAQREDRIGLRVYTWCVLGIEIIVLLWVVMAFVAPFADAAS